MKRRTNNYLIGCLLIMLIYVPSLHAIPVTYNLVTSDPTTIFGSTFSGEVVWDDTETVYDLTTAISWEFRFTVDPDQYSGHFDTNQTYSSAGPNDVFGSYGGLAVDPVTGDLVPEADMRWQISNYSPIFLRFISTEPYSIQYTSINLYDPFDSIYTSTFISGTEPVFAFGFEIAGSVEPDPELPVPEPTAMLLFGTGLLGLVGIRRKKTKK